MSTTAAARAVETSVRYVASPIGTLRLVATREALTRVDFPTGGASEPPPPGPSDARASPLLDRTESQLAEYFVGQRQAFDLPLAAAGTPFQESVWRALSTIPHGETRSYGEIAAQIGRPRASRAVGAANGRNPLSIIVPCHRVIGSSGQLVGFGGGLPRKRWLLDHEAP